MLDGGEEGAKRQGEAHQQLLSSPREEADWLSPAKASGQFALYNKTFKVSQATRSPCNKALYWSRRIKSALQVKASKTQAQKPMP